MPSTIHMLLHKLQSDFPDITFTPGEVFKWSPKEKTVYFIDTPSINTSELLHELSHALLGHTSYDQDVELLQIEREAWEYAQATLAPKYNVIIQNEAVETALDTYRDWLHARSICPDCGSNGLQTQTGTYKCFACWCQWRANDARLCELRRFKT